jgi:membrane protease YdiL (CAAX protease family)
VRILLLSAALSALVNLVLLGGIPFLGFFLFHKLKYRRRFGEIAQRSGLQLGDVRYIAYCAIVATIAVAVVVAWHPSVDALVRPGSPQRPFRGLGLTETSIAMALLYGVVQTGFTEELLFRGLLAGSLSRVLSIWWADVVQTLVFLIPHFLVLRVMPEMAIVLPFIGAGGLFVGWVRIKSGSIVGPWLIHGALNVAICLDVAFRTHR